MSTVAALYVDPAGVYAGLEGVEVWDEARDARLYPGPWPVVAHPPCKAWSRTAPWREAMHGLPAFEDGGCFAAALEAVRRFGGVLEHPASSFAWSRFGLSRPLGVGSWHGSLDGYWVAEVDQGSYGAPFRKLTWLYANVSTPPALRTATSRGRRLDSTSSGAHRAATPPAFRDVLLDMARTAQWKVAV